MRFQRDITLDVIRIIACLMVVLMHSPLPADDASGPFLVALSYLTAPCIGLFFMVSGALLIPVKLDYTTFMRRRLGKIVGPTIVWTIVYLCVRVIHSGLNAGLVVSLLSIPFSAQGHGVLWFMYTLTGLYLIAPILSAWLEKVRKSDIEIVLILWGLTLCYPILELWLSVNESPTGILYYFGGYAGYFLLGYYLKRYSSTYTLKLWCGSVIFLIGMGGLFGMKRKGIEFDFYRMFWYLSIFIAGGCVGIWCTLYKLLGDRIRLEGVIEFSNLTFGIYLVHILVMREWIWRISGINLIENYYMQTFLIFVLTVISSALMCFLISRFRFGQWIVGYSKRKEK